MLAAFQGYIISLLPLCHEMYLCIGISLRLSCLLNKPHRSSDYISDLSLNNAYSVRLLHHMGFQLCTSKHTVHMIVSTLCKVECLLSTVLIPSVPCVIWKQPIFRPMTLKREPSPSAKGSGLCCKVDQSVHCEGNRIEKLNETCIEYDMKTNVRIFLKKCIALSCCGAHNWPVHTEDIDRCAETMPAAD